MNQKTLEKLLTSEVKKVIEKSNRIFPKNQIFFDQLIIKFNLRGTTAGKACFEKYTLWFNLILADENLLQFTTDTIPHEIAHLYQRFIDPDSKPHGDMFYQVLAKMGYTGQRTHNYNTEVIKQSRKEKPFIAYKCNCPGKIHKMSLLLHKRMSQEGQKRRCVVCKGTIYPK